MLLDRIIDLVRSVPAFQDRVHGAMQLARLQQQNHLPEVTPAAFVIPTGLTGGTVSAISGLFTQTVGESVAVVIVMRSADDPQSSSSIDPLAAVCWDVIHTLAGIEMADVVGQLVFRRGFLVSFADSAAVYQLDFEISDQMRIPR